MQLSLLLIKTTISDMQRGIINDSLAHRQSEWPFSWHTTNQRIQWLRRPTANLLRLHMMNWSRQHPSGYAAEHTEQIYSRTSSKSPQMLQMSNGWASVFLPYD